MCWFYNGNTQRLTESCFYGEAGNRTCDPWFTRHRFIPNTTAASCGFPWVETSTAGRVYDLCVYYMTGAPEGSPKVVFMWFYGEAGNRTCDPWFTRHSTYPLHHGGFFFFVAFLGINQFRRVGLRFVCWFYDGNTQRLTESGFMEKPGIEPATPGLQGIALIHYTKGASRRHTFYFCGRVPWLYQYWPGGFMLFVVICPGTPEGSTGSGSGFKASQKTGQRLP